MRAEGRNQPVDDADAQPFKEFRGDTGSFNDDDPDRPRWDRDTIREHEYKYHHADGTYAYSKHKGRRQDGEKAFLTGRLSPEKPGDLSLDPEWPETFFKLPGLEHYKKGKGDEPDLLYRLPELVAAMAARPDDPVFICEGEKDTDTLWEPGLIATTNPNGALNWKSEFNAYFAGRDVAIMVDNDPKGRKRAVRIHAELKPFARSVKIIELNGLPENGDVTDWLDDGHTVEELLAAVDAADPEAPPHWARQFLDTIEFDRLAALPRVEYDRERKPAAIQLGINLKTLDREVEARRTVDDPSVRGSELTFEDVEPWPQTVDGSELIVGVAAVLKKHVIFPSDDHVLATVLWIIHTHLLAHAEHSPRLHITAPTKQCGKTVLLDAVAALVPRALRTEHVTSAALFRVVEEHRPTLLIDEVDTFLKDNEDMRGLLNAGHQPGGGVVRCVGDHNEVRRFSVFAATALAGIGEISATIEDRSITIPLRRRTHADPSIERLRRNRDHLQAAHKRIARWAADNGDRLNEDPALPEELGDRAQDNWRLMIAIADAIGESVGAAARTAARNLELERDHDDNDAGLMALADVFEVFGTFDRLSSQHIVDALIAKADRPWPQWRHGKPLTQNSLARLLKPFGIKTKQIKAFNGRGYERAPVVDAFARYCAAKPSEQLTDVDDPM